MNVEHNGSANATTGRFNKNSFIGFLVGNFSSDLGQFWTLFGSILVEKWGCGAAIGSVSPQILVLVQAQYLK